MCRLGRATFVRPRPGRADPWVAAPMRERFPWHPRIEPTPDKRDCRASSPTGPASRDSRVFGPAAVAADRLRRARTRIESKLTSAVSGPMMSSSSPGSGLVVREPESHGPRPNGGLASIQPVCRTLQARAVVSPSTRCRRTGSSPPREPEPETTCVATVSDPKRRVVSKDVAEAERRDEETGTNPAARLKSASLNSRAPGVLASGRDGAAEFCARL